MTKEQFSAQIGHIGRVYEAAKDGVYQSDMKAALDGLQEIRNIACEALKDVVKGQSQTKGEGMRWVPCREIMPSLATGVIFRFIHTKAPLIDPERWLKDNSEAIKTVEWLDESPSSPNTEAIDFEALCAQNLATALEQIIAQTRQPGETNDNYAFNRNWHIATKALEEYNKTT